MKRALIFLVSRLAKPLVVRYISRTTAYQYQGISIIVLPGVFHPRFFFSTKLLLKYFGKMPLRDQSFLELGAGSGLISLFAAKNGALVTACDISKTAVENIKENQKKNGLSFPVVHSDLFSNVSTQRFDIIAINPPYYKKDPVSEADHAWYCGKNSEYFVKLFSLLHEFIHGQTKVVMVLSEACDLPLISSLAEQHRFKLKKTEEHKLWLEKNFIFRIERLNA